MTRTTQRLHLIVAAALAATMVWNGCTKVVQNLPTPTPVAGESKIHEKGWSDSTSAAFHGVALRAATYNFSECQVCHSTKFTGGTSGVSCFRCHTSYPHNSVWELDTAALYHGNYLKLKSFQNTECQACHGTTFTGGTSGKGCFTCHTSYPHASAWMTVSAANSHGNYLKGKTYNTTECKSCHGNAFTGGTSGKDCFTCHKSYPHASTWTTTSSPSYHGNYLKGKTYNATECQSCHGSSFTGGTSSKSCYTCHASYPHTSGWLTTSATDYHGKYVKAKTWQATECQSCHGATYTGGTSSKSCYTCHSTYPHPANYASATGHPVVLRNSNYAAMTSGECKTCHGAGYAGGSITNVTCSRSGCHVDASSNAKSPEACNTCHGTFNGASNNLVSAAPPKAVGGATAPADPAVGAHQMHLVNATRSQNFQCQECHTVPATLAAAGHLDASPAEVMFNGTLGALKSDGGAFTPVPSYNPTSLRCSNTYCHGNWRLSKSKSIRSTFYADSVMTGGNFSPKWNGDGSSEATCGTCHDLPPQGHVTFAFGQPVTILNCANCHTGVINTAGQIIDASKHMNGKINVFGEENPM